MCTDCLLNTTEQSESHNWPTDNNALCNDGKIKVFVALTSSVGIGTFASCVAFIVFESGSVTIMFSLVGCLFSTGMFGGK